MKVLELGIMKNGTAIQIEEWNENYNFMPYANTIASYPKSKTSHQGSYSPRSNETYRFDFSFESQEEAKNAFNELAAGNKTLADFKERLLKIEYADCL